MATANRITDENKKKDDYYKCKKNDKYEICYKGEFRIPPTIFTLSRPDLHRQECSRKIILWVATFSPFTQHCPLAVNQSLVLTRLIRLQQEEVLLRRVQEGREDRKSPSQTSFFVYPLTPSQYEDAYNRSYKDEGLKKKWQRKKQECDAKYNECEGYKKTCDSYQKDCSKYENEWHEYEQKCDKYEHEWHEYEQKCHEKEAEYNTCKNKPSYQPPSYGKSNKGY